MSVSLGIGEARNSWEIGEAATQSLRFQIGCVTKALVAAVVLEIDATGDLSIEHPIASYLREFEGTSFGEQVLVRHLLSDTSGYMGFHALDGDTAKMNWQDLTSALSHSPRIFAPGTVCNLDQANAVLLGEIVKRVSGRCWMEQVDTCVGVPLFGRSLYDERDRHRLWAAAAANTTLSIEELSAMGEVLMTGRTSSLGGVLLESTVGRLQDAVVKIPPRAGGRVAQWLPIGHGLGLPEFHAGMSGEGGRGKGGDGGAQRTGLQFSRQSGVVVAVCALEGWALVRNEVMDAMLSEIGIQIPKSTGRVPMPCSLESLDGEYIGIRGVKVRVEVDGCRIRVLMNGSSGFATASCIANEDGSLSIENLDRHAPTAGIGFFVAPQIEVPSMMIGVHALRRA